MTATTDEPKKAPIEAFEEAEILVEDIVPDPCNVRDMTLETDEAELRALGEDMLANGQLQPIGVTAIGILAGSVRRVEYRCVWGLRRVAAARLVGKTSLRARVFVDKVDAATLSLAENAHRRPMTAIEEAQAVERLMRRYEVQGFTAATERVAKLLGRSGTWVRDRAFLLRLCAEARAEVNAGRLPLAHARELAKCIDPVVQKKLLADWLDPYYPLPKLDHAKADVFEHQGRLSQVGWDLGAPGVFKGAPACSECPNCSTVAGRQGLFEHDGDAPEVQQPRCLDHDCYLRKQGAIEKALEKMAAAGAGKKGAKRQEAIQGAAPVWMDSEAIDRAAAPPGGKDAPAKGSGQTPEQRAEAERKREEKIAAQRAATEAEAKAKKAAWKVVRAKIAARPGAMALVHAISHWGNELMRGKKPSQELKALGARLASGVPIDVELIDSLVAPQFASPHGNPWEDLEDFAEPAVKKYLEGMFLGVADAPAPTAATPAAPKKKSKKRKTTRKPALKGGLD